MRGCHNLRKPHVTCTTTQPARRKGNAHGKEEQQELQTKRKGTRQEENPGAIREEKLSEIKEEEPGKNPIGKNFGEIPSKGRAWRAKVPLLQEALPARQAEVQQRQASARPPARKSKLVRRTRRCGKGLLRRGRWPAAKGALEGHPNWSRIDGMNHPALTTVHKHVIRPKEGMP